VRAEGLDRGVLVVGETADVRHVDPEVRSYPPFYPQNELAPVWCEEMTLMSHLERSLIPTHVFYFD
jgi:hypothetical protein